MRIERAQLHGPQVIDRDLTMYGQFVGDVRVESNASLTLHGQCTGRLTVAPGANAVVFGMVVGEIVNEGGYVELHGMAGSVRTESGHTVIDPGAVVGRR